MKRTDLFKEMTALIDYIEDHIEENLSLERLAEHVSISKYHLTRLFKVMCHKNLVSYVRARKLAYSLDALIHSDEKIIDLALRIGFDYEQSFIRAFKSEFGITPHQYRLSEQAVDYVKKLDFGDVVCIENGFWLVPKIQKLKPFVIWGCPLTLTRETVETSWHQSIHLFWEEHIKKSSPRPEDYWGLGIRNPAETGQLTYVTGLHTNFFCDNSTPIPPHFVKYAVTPTAYAIFKYIGHHGLEELTALKVRHFNDSIINDWLRNLGYSCRTPVHIVIDRIPTAYVSENYCELHVYVPIRGEDPPLLTTQL